ncbi:hypothetical protein [Brevundimonas sp. PAMC22021]|uniref:hypothetical protein n=1 Tax=Brevundimonas sp. PAMC22021 TaxID=2861285 RepID=UPI001C638D4C|nr:hypothetical protein [Brevundimonas sp. PAMC22021]QYF86157.1 hypothetical protein KY493_09905 [Brevundimonas sp. PAMC22021]
MIRQTLFASAALLLANCAPQAAAPVTDGPVRSADASACAQRGGTLKQVGRLQSWQCVVNYADAGKRCTDGDQCQGDCRLPDGAPTPAPNASVAGVCQANSDNFGCHTSVEDGKVGVGICID